MDPNLKPIVIPGSDLQVGDRYAPFTTSASADYAATLSASLRAKLFWFVAEAGSTTTPWALVERAS